MNLIDPPPLTLNSELPHQYENFTKKKERERNKDLNIQNKK